MINLFKDSKIMVIVAHPDDEVLGCGATLYSLIKNQKCTVKVVILGEGLTSRTDKRNLDEWKLQLDIHKKNIINAQGIIGYQELSVYDFPDNRFDTVALLDIIKVIEKEKNNFEPDFILTHHSGDLNIDHQRTFQAVLTSIRPMQEEKVKGVLTFETPSGTEWQSTSDPRRFTPNIFMDINEEAVNAKIEAMEAYEFESRPYPHPRSPQALKILAQNRGVNVGSVFAESFQLIRLKLN